MKKLLFFAILAFSITFNVQGQVYKTINVGTAGTLNSLLSQTEKNTITNLTVTGYINALDYYDMGYLTSLTVLDISAVTIQSYVGYIADPGLPSYPANEIPHDASTSKKGLKSITLPNTITSIGNSDFDLSGNVKPGNRGQAFYQQTHGRQAPRQHP